HLFFLTILQPPRSTLFPYTTLFRSKQRRWALDLRLSLLVLFTLAWIAQRSGTSILIAGFGAGVAVAVLGGPKRLSTQVRGVAEGDRKSTRLNSSHSQISYAVFCLKK